MKLFVLLLVAIPVLSACGNKFSENPEREPEVVHQGGAFNSCPPAHAAQGRC